jgi:acetoacetyl-CoA synthetase
MSIQEGELLWEPGEALKNEANISKFMHWLAQNRGLEFENYQQLWQWSVDDIEAFWEGLWHFFDVKSGTPYECVLRGRQMPGAQWFPGSRLNYAEHVLRNERADAIALHAYSELDDPQHVSWEELGAQVRQLAQQLRIMGVQPGDRVVTYLPNTPETVVAFLATAAIGAIFSSCSPDFGHKSVVDRFRQIEPKVLFCSDGYRFGGKDFDRRDEVAEIIQSLPSLEQVVQVPNLFKDITEPVVSHTRYWDDLMAGATVPPQDFHFEQLDFDHPLWIVYSSGTTGLPKPIVHGHGGIILEFFKLLGFHMNQKPDSSMFFFTTTGWVMWNITVGSLIMGGAAVLYDGNPVGEDPSVLWHLAEDSGTTFFGASPTYVAAMEKQGIVPGKLFDLSKMEGILLGGSPATPEVMSWCYENIKQDLWVTSQSGGTDVCSAFVGASPTLPVYAGEIQTRCLAVDAHAYSDNGESLVGEVGELVIRQSMPSMPIYFWNDEGNVRYKESYFEDYPGVWRHGDYFLVNERGGCFINGRSDSTLNRYGVRIGTAEIYRTVEQLDEIEDSLIVNLDLPDGKFFMPLFVKLKNGLMLNENIQGKIRSALRSGYSPRHVPDKIIQVDAIPYTLTGKKLEVPVRKILAGAAPEKAANKDAMSNPEALDFFIDYFRVISDYEITTA